MLRHSSLNEPFVVRLEAFGDATASGELAHEGNNLLPFNVLVSTDSQTFSGELIHHRQGTKASAVEQSVRDEIHGPAIIGMRYLGASAAVTRHTPSFGPLGSEVESSQTVDAVHALDVDAPSLPPQEDMDAPVAVTNPDGGNLLHALAGSRVEHGTLGLVAHSRAVGTQHPHGSALTHPPGVLQLEHEFPFYRWL